MSKDTDSGKVASFTGKTIEPGQHTYYNDADGNERRAAHGDQIAVENVSNLKHLVERGIVVVTKVSASKENVNK